MEIKSILLDTNAYSAYFYGDKKIEKVIQSAIKVYISVITLGELVAGFLRGTRLDRNQEELHIFIKKYHIQIVDISKETAQIYAYITTKLHEIGKPIPTNDIWIAAQTIETNSTLITYDSHFLAIAKLKVWNKLKMA